MVMPKFKHLVPWDALPADYRDRIIMTLEHEYAVLDQTEWLPGTIHLRVWPYDDTSLIFFWVLLLKDSAIRIFPDRGDCLDACTLRGLEGRGSWKQLSAGNIGQETRYYIQTVHTDRIGSISLTYNELLKFLGPIPEEP